MVRIGIVSLLVGFLVVLGFEARTVLKDRASATASMKAATEKLDKAKIDNESLGNDYQYYSNPINLEKELRARFNYRSPGEKMIIVVPATPGERGEPSQGATTTTTSSP
ncbi:MAG: hypothetical protein Q7S28_03050 [bacterium]|nr:hypothetical protein [bacterium]